MMRWGLFAAALLGVCIVQPGFVSALRVPIFAHLDLFLTLALACGLLAPPRQAPVAGWIVGLAADLLGAGTLGACAAGYGAAALVLCLLREWLRADLWWVRLLICLLAVVLAELTASALGAVSARLWTGSTHGVWTELRGGLGGGLLAALLASLLPLVLRLFTGPRRRGALAG